MNDQSPSRTGGRAARRAARSAALPDHMRPVRAGMSGGTLKVLSDEQIKQITSTLKRLCDLRSLSLADVDNLLRDQAGDSEQTELPISVTELSGGHA